MSWITDNLQIIATLGSAWAVYYFLRKPIDKMEIELKEMRLEIKDIRKDVQSLDSRIARIEGQLIGPPRWEPKVLEKKEE
jgi:predicted  nucleic acid-binding Zn-ribbon protein